MSRQVVGVDEAGRGALAGPVVAAAVILPEEPFPWLAEIKDSKKISPGKREKLSQLIKENSIWGLAAAGPHNIDEMNILYATLFAMKEAVEQVYRQAFHREAIILVDGNFTIPTGQENCGWLEAPWPQAAVPHGDNLHQAIAAASILAKVHRDHFMVSVLDEQHPEYQFRAHKGYGTKAHREAIRVFGPSPEHRRTFRGVAEYVR